MRFRLANTSWRGLRMRFTGSVGGAYMPFAVMYLWALAAGVLFGLSASDMAHQDITNKAVAAQLALAFLGLSILLWPALEYLIKRYQHNHYQLGQWQTQLQTGPWGFYKVYLKLMGLMLILMVVSMVPFVGSSVRVAAAIFGGLLPIFMIFMVQLCIRPYLAIRMQNLVWGHTGHPQVQFRSRLRLRDYLPDYLVYGLLTLITMGLYWPVAQIALTKLRLQAITIESQVPLSSAVAQWLAHPERDATGDAAGDLLGFDISL